MIFFFIITFYCIIFYYYHHILHQGIHSFHLGPLRARTVMNRMSLSLERTFLALFESRSETFLLFFEQRCEIFCCTSTKEIGIFIR
jgi:hypothetical protein